MQTPQSSDGSHVPGYILAAAFYAVFLAGFVLGLIAAGGFTIHFRP